MCVGGWGGGSDGRSVLFTKENNVHELSLLSIIKSA